MDLADVKKIEKQMYQVSSFFLNLVDICREACGKTQ